MTDWVSAIVMDCLIDWVFAFAMELVFGLPFGWMVVWVFALVFALVFDSVFARATDSVFGWVFAMGSKVGQRDRNNGTWGTSGKPFKKLKILSRHLTARTIVRGAKSCLAVDLAPLNAKDVVDKIGFDESGKKRVKYFLNFCGKNYC